MVTDDERRAAANTIRKYNGQANCMYLVKYAACRGDLDASENEFLNCLADLIEPEPERTCRMRDAHWDDGRRTWGCICSECGAKHERKSGKWMNYCPNCGAKVVEE